MTFIYTSKKLTATCDAEQCVWNFEGDPLRVKCDRCEHYIHINTCDPRQKKNKHGVVVPPKNYLCPNSDKNKKTKKKSGSRISSTMKDFIS